MLSFLYVYSDHSILECYNLFSGVELSMRSFFVIIIIIARCVTESVLISFNIFPNYPLFDSQHSQNYSKKLIRALAVFETIENLAEA